MSPLPPHRSRRPEPASPAFTLELSRKLCADPRFLGLAHGQQLALLFGVLRYSDADGKFWPSRKRWAADLQVTDRHIRNTVEAAERAGLVERELWARPNGRQGASIVRLDGRLVESVTESLQGRNERSGGGGTGVPTNLGRNKPSPRKGGTSDPALNGTIRTGEIDHEGRPTDCPTCDDTRVVYLPPDEKGYTQSVRCPDCAGKAAA